MLEVAVGRRGLIRPEYESLQLVACLDTQTHRGDVEFAAAPEGRDDAFENHVH
jgi:hypothetical protein